MGSGRRGDVTEAVGGACGWLCALRLSLPPRAPSSIYIVAPHAARGVSSVHLPLPSLRSSPPAKPPLLARRHLHPSPPAIPTCHPPPRSFSRGYSKALQERGISSVLWTRGKLELEMSATILSAFYDIDLFCKNEKVLNNLNLSSMLDKKAVGSPVSAPNSSLIPEFLRRHSTSNLQALANNNNSVSKFCNNNLKDSVVNTTALLNKENKFRDRSFSENGERSQHLLHLQQQQQQQKSGAQINSTRYKTELCRPFEESGTCKYGEKCQFAHGFHELRSLTRHPKYKTELCRTFHTIGFCPYGPRCHFIHNAEERRQAPGGGGSPTDCFNGQRPKLHHSLSFSGFPNHSMDSPLLESPTSRTPPPQPSNSLYCEESVPCANNAFTFSGQELSLITPLAIQTHNLSSYNTAAFCRQQQPPASSNSPPPTLNFQPLRRLSESPVFDAPPSPPDSLSDRESYLSGSLSSGSLSGSDSPTLDSNRRLPIFSRLSISDD